MEPIPYDTSEENKENLPPWLLERSSRRWDGSRPALADVTPPASPQHYPLRIRLIQPIDATLAMRISDLSVYGRGGNAQQRAATLPSSRPKKRPEIPSLLRVPVWKDPSSPVACTPDKSGLLEAVKPVSTYKLALTRPRAFTYPAVRPKPANSERPICHTHMPIRLPFVLLESGEPDQRTIGRRVQSLSTQMHNLAGSKRRPIEIAED